MTAHQRFPSDRLWLPGDRPRNFRLVSLDVAEFVLRVLFWLGLAGLPFVVILCTYGGGGA